MIALAKQKIQGELPTADNLTTAMILRAENRTVTSVMNARSSHQLKEVLSAAYCRAGLIPPFEAVKNEKPDIDGESKMEETAKSMTEAMTTQTSMLAQKKNLMAQQPKVEHMTRVEKKVENQAKDILTCATSLRILQGSLGR